MASAARAVAAAAIDRVARLGCRGSVSHHRNFAANDAVPLGYVRAFALGFAHRNKGQRRVCRQGMARPCVEARCAGVGCARGARSSRGRR